jgi:hypothetical protein
MAGDGSYRHKANTFINTPDQNFSNVKAKQPTTINKTLFDIYMASGSMYFELGNGYPRNHYTHKLQQFSKCKYGDYTAKIFVKGRQSVDSTINENGINDGSLPVWTSDTSNVNISTTNIIRTVPTIIAGQVVPSGTTTTAGVPTQPPTPTVRRRWTNTPEGLYRSIWNKPYGTTNTTQRNLNPPVGTNLIRLIPEGLYRSVYPGGINPFFNPVFNPNQRR